MVSKFRRLVTALVAASAFVVGSIGASGSAFAHDNVGWFVEYGHGYGHAYGHEHRNDHGYGHGHGHWESHGSWHGHVH